MIDDKELDEATIADIILCEPITSKGRESLTRLGLTTQDISPSYFLNTIRVESKYDEDKEYETKERNRSAQTELYYKYTVDYIQFEELKNRLMRFRSRLCSNSPNEYPLLILGVAGNGKSIEINREIRELTNGESEVECGRAYLDLEEAFTEITYGIEYNCPKWTPLWLFCIKLLDSIMKYIRHCHALCPQIFERFNDVIVKENLASEKQIMLFKNIGNYCIGDNEKETAVFSSLKALLKSQQAEEDIRTLLKTLMWIMYCSAPDQKHYIVFDNIEQYIKLNNSKIQIPNSDISKIYKSINNVVINIVNTFNRIEKDLGWKAFKIIIVLRRTSLGLLDSTLLHSAVKAEQNVTDFTGYFQIPDIWKSKKKYVWMPLLRSKFDNSKNEDIIKLIDFIMEDGVQAVGTDYQSIIAPLMSYGIRRNAKSQAHSIYETYKILSNEDEKTISLDGFYTLMMAASSSNDAVRYMFRRALIELQFKWPMSNENQDRWRELGIGHLSGQKECNYLGKKFLIEGVSYYNDKCVTLMRRILAFLFHFPDKSTSSTSQHKSIADMFSTLSLYDLIEGVLVDPRGHKEIPEDDFLQFARVLIALGDMSNGDTKSAPYVILGIRDNNFHANPYDSVLAELLKKIWKEGRSESLPGGKYHSGDYGVRITDAGEAFLLDWQPSFSFMASLHCFTIPPLFFLRDISSIKYVIETVYKASSELCVKYEEEAAHFCGNNITLKKGTYLPQYNGKYVTFRQRVRELHINHLSLYRKFIELNYVSLKLSHSSMQELTQRHTGFIDRFISKYASWKTDEEAPECF
jgi:hypothetical protein